jgi:proton-translocating NADH-quinone oxidoreductase chain N
VNVIIAIAISFIAAPMAVILICNVLPRKTADRASFIIAGAASLIQVAAASAGFAVLLASRLGYYEFSVLWDMTKTTSERFSISPLNLTILFCVGMVSFIAVLVANQTVGKKKSAFVTLMMTLMLGMNGMVIVTDLFSLYVFLEITGISSFVLIAMFKTDTGLEGAFKYLVMSSLASLCILTGLAFIFAQTGSLRYEDLGGAVLAGAGQPQPVLTYAALILLIAGFLVKTGAAPFHSWLPDAHQSANTAVSVLLSGIVIKVAGIYGLIVLRDLFLPIPSLNLAISVIGVISILAGALLALRQDHFKRIVALSSVSQMGYILLGVGSGSVLGLLGAVIHIFNHAVAKGTLFTNAAALHEQTGTLDINEMGGLQKKMPVTAFSSVSAFLSITGMPPFIGFWSKLLIILALWRQDAKILAGIALFASILTAAYFLRMQTRVFFGELPERFAEVKEARGSIRFAEILLTVILIAAGVAFPLVLLFLQGQGIV